jgi:microcystin-dependent protein
MTIELLSISSKLIEALRTWFHPKDRSVILGSDCFIEGDEVLTPGTPVTDRRRLYAKDDGWYEIDDGGVETKFSGPGGINVHTHANNPQGGQLDWDDIWTDAVHDHSSDAEGGRIVYGGIIGEVRIWVTDAAPTNWLLCYGQPINRIAYANLFSVIGTTFGVGDGVNTFNLPDLRGRVVIGQDDMGGSSANRITDVAADSIGGTGGAETHTLVSGEMPVHTHVQNAHNHLIDTLIVGGAGTARQDVTNAGGGTATITSRNTTATNQNTGGDGAHANTQPWMALNFIICTGI